MTISLGTAEVAIGANVTNLASGIGTAKTLIAGLTGATLGAAAAVTKMGADFESGTLTVVTGAGEQLKNLGMVRDGMLKTAAATGTSTQQLIAAQFMIESSGQHGAKSLKTLMDVAEGAKVGVADLGVTANATTTIMTDYAAQNVTSAQAVNDLIATVASGKTHMQDLAGAFSTILPTSAAVHVSLLDTSAAMATMTSEGTNASAAATYLRQLLIALEAPASKGATALKDIGLTTKQVSDEMRVSLPGALQIIMDHLAETYTVGSPQYIEALKNIAGGSRQMQGILELTGTHLQTFKDDVKSIGDAVKAGGDKITGWNLVQDTFNQKMDVAKAKLETLGIQLGTDLLPILGRLTDWFTSAAIPNIQSFAGWIGQLADAFQQATTPIQQVQTALSNVNQQVDASIYFMKPITDAWDRGSVSVKNLGTAIGPVTDAYDRHNKTLDTVKDSHKVYTDALDRGSIAITDFTGAHATATTAINPMTAAVKELLPEVSKLSDWVVQTALPNLRDLGTWFVKTGIPAIKDLAGAVQTNLLPPLGDLITNVLHLGEDFTGWLQSSGTLKDALLSVSNTLGTLVGWVAGFVGWLDKGGPGVTAFAIAVGTVGTAIAAIKIAEFTAGLVNMFTKLSEGSGIVANLATKALPELSTALGWTKTKGDAAAVSVKAVGDNAKSASVPVTTLGNDSQTAATKVTTLGTDAKTTATAETTLGNEAETAAGKETTLGTNASIASGEVTTLGADAGIAAGEEETLGVNAGTASGEMTAMGTSAVSSKAALAGMVPVIGQVFLLFTQLRDVLGSIKLPGGLTTDQAAAAMQHGLPGGFNPWPFGHAEGGMIAPGDVGIVGEHGPEFVYGGSSGASVTSTSESAAILRGSGGGSRQPAILNLTVDSREIASLLIPHIAPGLVQHIRLITGGLR